VSRADAGDDPERPQLEWHSTRGGLVEHDIGIGYPSGRFGTRDRDLTRRLIDADGRAPGSLDRAQDELAATATDVEQSIALRERALTDEAIENGAGNRISDRDSCMRDR
jgi:hypothetical protein